MFKNRHPAASFRRRPSGGRTPRQRARSSRLVELFAENLTSIWSTPLQSFAEEDLRGVKVRKAENLGNAQMPQERQPRRWNGTTGQARRGALKADFAPRRR